MTNYEHFKSWSCLDEILRFMVQFMSVDLFFLKINISVNFPLNVARLVRGIQACGLNSFPSTPPGTLAEDKSTGMTNFLVDLKLAFPLGTTASPTL